MKFRTRLMITALSMILLPFFLTILAFLVLGSHIEGTEFTNGFLNNNNSYTIENYSRMTEEVLKKVKEQIAEDASVLEDKEYLEELAGELKSKSSYIIVRKEEDLYYTNNDGLARKIFAMLPDYGSEIPEAETGYYYNDLRKLVKEIDFIFPDGSQGSFFIVTGVSSLISKNLLTSPSYREAIPNKPN